jgi:hypothetical protein
MATCKRRKVKTEKSGNIWLVDLDELERVRKR